jgi:hypothetical protein
VSLRHANEAARLLYEYDRHRILPALRAGSSGRTVYLP